MTMLGKILAVFNLLLVCLLMYLAGRAYYSHKAWNELLETRRLQRDGVSTEALLAELKQKRQDLDTNEIKKYSDVRQRHEISEALYADFKGKLDKLAIETLRPDEKDKLLQEAQSLAKELADKVGPEAAIFPLQDKIDAIRTAANFEEKVRAVAEADRVAIDLANKLQVGAAPLYEQLKARLDRLKAPTLEEKERLTNEAKELAKQLSPPPAPSLKTGPQPKLGPKDLKELMEDHIAALHPIMAKEEELMRDRKVRLLVVKDALRRQIETLETNRAFLTDRLLALEKELTQKILVENEARRRELAAFYVELEEVVAARNLAQARQKDMENLLKATRQRIAKLAQENQKLAQEIVELEKKLARAN